MPLIRAHMEQRSLIGMNSSAVRKIEIVLRKKYLPNMKNVKCFFLIKVTNKDVVVNESVRLKEKEQKEKETKFISN